MGTQAQIVAEIDAAFGAAKKPFHFTDYEHCGECLEHDQLFLERDRGSLKIEDVGNPGWDPLCFCSPEGIAYYMPSLVRLAFERPTYNYGWYGEQLVFHFINHGKHNAFLKFCDARQRRAVVGLLKHLGIMASQDHAGGQVDFIVALKLWSEAPTDA